MKPDGKVPLSSYSSYVKKPDVYRHSVAVPHGLARCRLAKRTSVSSFRSLFVTASDLRTRWSSSTSPIAALLAGLRKLAWSLGVPRWQCRIVFAEVARDHGFRHRRILFPPGVYDWIINDQPIEDVRPITHRSPALAAYKIKIDY